RSSPKSPCCDPGRKAAGAHGLIGTQARRYHLRHVGHDQAMGLTTLSAQTRDRLTDAELTDSEGGATAKKLPARDHHIKRRRVLGRGQQVFAAAATDVAAWQVQLRAGLTVAASAPTATPGTVVELGLSLGPLRLSVPCRVVYAVDQSRRQGFAYGT